jgi:proton glutamate symport protein
MLQGLKSKFNFSDKKNEELDSNLPYGMPPEEVSKPYPRPVQIVANAIFFVWNNILLQPFLRTWGFLAARTSLTFWIIFGMVIGILIGHFAPEAGVELKPLGDAFIRMITIIETPLIFSTLVVGIAGHGDDVGRVGRLAVKTIIVSVIKCISKFVSKMYIKLFSILKLSLHLLWLSV